MLSLTLEEPMCDDNNKQTDIFCNFYCLYLGQLLSPSHPWHTSVEILLFIHSSGKSRGVTASTASQYLGCLGARGRQRGREKAEYTRIAGGNGNHFKLWARV